VKIAQSAQYAQRPHSVAQGGPFTGVYIDTLRGT
jgi:hypothetical protein